LSTKKEIQVICIGEILIDFIGSHASQDIASTTEFKRYLGGSPTNVAMNLTKLGCQAAVVATIGNDGLGDFLLQQMHSLKMPTTYVRKVTSVPTSAILVSKTADTPDFIAYREADCLIEKEQIPDALLKTADIFHTTCFALSRNPAQNTILEKAQIASEAGCLISIDLNYSEKIWPDRSEAMEIIKRYCSFQPIIKVSMDDMERLLGPGTSMEELFQFLHEHGAQLVCFTRGGNGVVVSQKGKDHIHMPAIPLNSVVDATGAGDAFWAGFLCAKLSGKGIEECVQFALKVASIKLMNVGGLPDNLDLRP
jgi:fructokinase